MATVALLLFGSGFCALVYQVTWFREFRLIFGGSTPATAAVLAIFMGGLGIGSVRLGKGADGVANPLLRYARLELGIALSAAVTPGLLKLMSLWYVALGGSESIGLPAATAVRLLVAVAVLAVPTVLMGGTLPAAARSVETRADEGRRRVSLLYASNTLGAVAGCLVATFYLFEHLGNHLTLWLAVTVNLAVAGIARWQSRTVDVDDGASADEPASAPAWFVLTAASGVGFAFFLMEMVWNRMLSPLLGGTTYTFGLILAVALLGVGLGGGLYSVWGRRQSGAGAFATSCAVEGLLMAVAHALGDRLAVLALLLRSLSPLGFGAMIAGWALICAIVVFPGACVAGFQFPMLISLLGRGSRGIGKDSGAAYAWNTAGAIMGALVGGMLLVPRLGAGPCWILACAVLSALALIGLWVDPQRGVAPRIRTAGAVLVCMLLLSVPGPSAFWRQSPIGAGRMDDLDPAALTLHNTINNTRDSIVWQVDGQESGVGFIKGESGYAFLQNGKSDGNSVSDAGTQVWLGLAPALLRPPRHALVIGLGTGSTAGWLASIPGVERVDVVEIEPVILHVAAACAPVNRDCLSNPKVHVHIADAREFLLTTREHYDLIVSEPSNPYRAGISSLFTREFYQAAASHLSSRGVFCQWVQAYEVEADTLRTFIATFSKSFSRVDMWSTQQNDLMLIGTAVPIEYDVHTLRSRIQEQPFRSAMQHVFHGDSLEAFLARHVATVDYVDLFRNRPGTRINTDDRNVLEYSYARTLGSDTGFGLARFAEDAGALGLSRPPVFGGPLDWSLVEDSRSTSDMGSSLAAEGDTRAEAKVRYQHGDLKGALLLWNTQPAPPQDALEHVLVGEGLAEQADARCLEQVRQLRPDWEVEADMMEARYNLRSHRPDQATDLLVKGFTVAQSDPWPLFDELRLGLELSEEIGPQDAAAAQRLFDVLQRPFSMERLNLHRLSVLCRLARILDGGQPGPRYAQVLDWFGPAVPWEGRLLAFRVQCYRRLHDPRERAAQKDLDAYLSEDRAGFIEGE